MNDYEALLKLRTDRAEFARKMRNAQFVHALREDEKAQPRRLRFHIRIRLPRFAGFRSRRQPECTPLNANAH